MMSQAPKQSGTTPKPPLREYAFAARSQTKSIRSTVVARSEAQARRRMLTDLREHHRMIVKPENLELLETKELS